jgi:hypothetical protein
MWKSLLAPCNKSHKYNSSSFLASSAEHDASVQCVRADQGWKQGGRTGGVCYNGWNPPENMRTKHGKHSKHGHSSLQLALPCILRVLVSSNVTPLLQRYFSNLSAEQNELGIRIEYRRLGMVHIQPIPSSGSSDACKPTSKCTPEQFNFSKKQQLQSVLPLSSYLCLLQHFQQTHGCGHRQTLKCSLLVGRPQRA